MTRGGTRIANEVEDLVPSTDLIGKYSLVREKFGANWIERKSPSGGYNCAGMVWAARRTSIFEDAAIQSIIDDDGYQPVSDVQHARPGDLAIYRTDKQYFLHVGIVVEVRTIVVEARREPWVLSKFGPGMGEVLHRIDDKGHLRDFDVQASVWTDRL